MYGLYEFMDVYFGVLLVGVFVSGLCLFWVKEGFKDVGVCVVGCYMFLKYWNLNVLLFYCCFIGDVKDSLVICDCGLDGLWFGGFVLGYMF